MQYWYYLTFNGSFSFLASSIHIALSSKIAFPCSSCSLYSEDEFLLTINEENDSLGSQIKDQANFGLQNLKE